MNKEKNKMIPDFRFPEFVNDGEWEEKFVEDFFLVGSSKRVMQEDWTSQGVPFYRTRELVSLSKNEPFRNEIFISEKLFSEISEKYGIPSEGDFLVSGVGTLGICYQVKVNDKFYFKDGNVLWFKLEKGLNSTYFKFCFQSDYIQNQIVKQASISTVGTYTIQNAKKTTLWYPQTPNEQQKVASCLSSLDEVIAAHSQKIEALKAHKKGLMQNLFPQEGETVPKFRFPEFRRDGEWVEKKLGDCLLQNPEYGINAPAVPFSTILPTYLRITDISEDGRFLSNEKVSVDREVSEYNYLSYGDIVLARTGASVGKSYKYRIEDGRLVFAGFLIRLKPDSNKLNSDFLFQFLSTKQYWKWVSFISARSGQPGINATEYSSLPICLPINQDEQRKIASCLSTLDDLIMVQGDKIKQLKLHKKGLMQGLFPKIID